MVIEEKDLTGEKLVQTVSAMLAQPGKLAEMGKNDPQPVCGRQSGPHHCGAAQAGKDPVMQPRNKQERKVRMMQQNRDRNGRPRNPRPYDLNRDVARTSAPSQNHNTPRSTGSSRYGYNGEPLSRPPSRSANGSVRSSRADNSIQFPTQTQSQPRRPAQGQGSNTTQYPAGNRPAGSRPQNAKSGGKQRRPANNARSGQNSRKKQNYQNANRQHPAGSQSAPQQSPARREQRKKAQGDPRHPAPPTDTAPSDRLCHAAVRHWRGHLPDHDHAVPHQLHSGADPGRQAGDRDRWLLRRQHFAADGRAAGREHLQL